MKASKRLARAKRKAKANRLQRWQNVPVWQAGTPAIKPLPLLPTPPADTAAVL